MYAKVLIPSDNGLSLPLVIAILPATDTTTVDALHSIGWKTYGNECKVPGAQLTITDGFVLSVDGQVFIKDSVNPVAPDGWWDAVSKLNDHVLALVINAGQIDLQSPQLASEFPTLLDNSNTAFSLVPLVH